MPRLTCVYCATSFTRPYGLRRHNNKFHNGHFVQLNPSALACKQCSTILKTRSGLRRHQRRYHRQHPENDRDEVYINEGFATFEHPCRVCVAGATMTGKTAYVISVLVHGRLQPPPDRLILVCRYNDQPAYQQLRNVVPQMTVYVGMPTGGIEWTRDGERTLIILDDVMVEAHGDEELNKLFTGGSHHKNTSIIIIQQDLFPEARHAVVNRKNASHIVLTDTCVARRQVMDLSQSIRPLKPTAVYNAYEQVMSQGLYPRFIIDGSVHQGVFMRQYYKR